MSTSPADLEHHPACFLNALCAMAYLRVLGFDNVTALFDRDADMAAKPLCMFVHIENTDWYCNCGELTDGRRLISIPLPEPEVLWTRAVTAWNLSAVDVKAAVYNRHLRPEVKAGISASVRALKPKGGAGV
jgi:hypothetical protein